jgi:hypothetical protein
VLRPMFEAAPSVASPLSLCRAAASGHQCANAVAAAKAYEDYKHERNERGHQNTPEDSCLTYWNPKRRITNGARLGPKTGVQYATQTRCPATLKACAPQRLHRDRGLTLRRYGSNRRVRPHLAHDRFRLSRKECVRNFPPSVGG